ncbi:hypothetical protein [Pedobacter agri]|uniref:Secreted protein with PEP-CTERM sorting signal n=1 Tax=Pedobacter agri TaxID=454586 RepID=A0A9X3I6V7_9SPHI|nr:hypothetical protein [Pedobacter agri]MCX3263127.1 hypothetical protein [Pedobacter agri]
MSIPSRFFVVTMLLVFSAISAFAADGCYVFLSVPEPRIYYVQQPGSTGTPVQFFQGSPFYNVNCPAGASTATTHPVITGDATTPRMNCWAEKYRGTNFNNSGNYIYNGYLVSYTFMPCPIDDYIVIVIIGMAGAGVVRLRRKNLA